MEPYQFTHDWAQAFRNNVADAFSHLADRPLQYLEVGVYEGQSACYMLDTVLIHPESRATLIDHKVQDQGWLNLERHLDKITVYEGNSRVILPRLADKFDIIYIDGDHSSRGAIFDSVLCWLRLNDWGYIIWDDYQKHDDGCGVNLAVDNFLACLPKHQYKVIFNNFQICVQALFVDSMRIHKNSDKINVM